jgi:Zn-dependent M28 family amino/carboxypeptidase
VGIVAAIPVIATTVGSRSPGGLDNATGVATVLAAAEETRATRFGVCLTSAEELGLAGARAWMAGVARNAPAVAINCDSVDDRGTTTCMYSGRRPGALVASVLAAGTRSGSRIRAHRLLPGVLTDGVALADASWDVVTLSKGGARTLARIHTPLDRADQLTGTGMDEVTRVIVELLESTSSAS